MIKRMRRCRLAYFAGAALMALTAQAGAQTNAAANSVTLYGVIDACLVSHKGASGTSPQVNGGGCSFGSRFGLRGTEDLGGGLKAYFQLESGFFADTGALNQNGRLFGRKALVGLGGAFGAVEAGRDYAPAFYLLTAIDPMQLGIGSVIATQWSGSPGTASGRTDNNISYQSPTAGGFAVRAMYAPGEQVAPAAKHGGDTHGYSLMYRSERMITGATYARVKNPVDSGDDSAVTLAVKYDFGAFSLAASAQSGRWEGSRTAAAPSSATSIFSRRFKSYMLGGTLKLGTDFLSATYKRYDDRTAANFDANIWSVVYTHPLSKRTQLYAGASRLKNLRGSAYGASDGNGAYTGVANGGASRIVDLGITHFF